MTTVPLTTDLAAPLVARLWAEYGAALQAQDRAERIAKVAELIAPFEPEPREVKLIQGMIEDRVRDNAAPADTPQKRGTDRLFR